MHGISAFSTTHVELQVARCHQSFARYHQSSASKEAGRSDGSWMHAAAQSAISARHSKFTVNGSAGLDAAVDNAEDVLEPGVPDALDVLIIGRRPRDVLAKFLNDKRLAI
jgi:hypothetical protein